MMFSTAATARSARTTATTSRRIISRHQRCFLSSISVPEQPWLLNKKYQYFQNGKWVSSEGPTANTVRNPIDTNEIVGNVPEMTQTEFDQTVALAKDAFHEWKLVPVQQRQRIMLKFQQAIRNRTDDLAYLITLENGKTIADARGDVFRGLEMVESACFIAPTLQGESLQGIATDMDCVSFREPLGVCAGKCNMKQKQNKNKQLELNSIILPL